MTSSSTDHFWKGWQRFIARGLQHQLDQSSKDYLDAGCPSEWTPALKARCWLSGSGKALGQDPPLPESQKNHEGRVDEKRYPDDPISYVNIRATDHRPVTI